MNRHALVSEKKPQSTEKDAEEPSALQLPSAPTSTLDTSLAKAYTHIHPVLVLAAFFARFQSLVADPSATLLNSLAIVGLLQIVYVVTCLPPTTNTTAASPKTPQKQGRGSKAKSGKGDASAVSRIVVCGVAGSNSQKHEALTLWVACAPLPPLDNRPRNPSPHHSHHPLWCSHHDSPTLDDALRRPHGLARHHALGIRPRRGLAALAGGGSSHVAF